MSVQEFHSKYLRLRDLKVDASSLMSQTKAELSKNLGEALFALRCADSALSCLTDTIASSTRELVAQCEETRRMQNKVSETATALPARPTFSEVVRTPPTIVLKPKETSGGDDRDAMETRIGEALKSVNVSSARITSGGNCIVSVPNEVSHKKATEILQSTMSDEYTIHEENKLAPKLTVTNVSTNIADADFIPALREKDPNIDEMLLSGETFEVLRSSNSGNVKNLVLRCSPKIRNYIVETNAGWVYLNLGRCKVYDRFFVPQCYQCCSPNHFARSCPDKDKPIVCGKCAGAHKSKECTSNTLKCINCVRQRPNDDNNHCSFSKDCPILIRMRMSMKNRTDYGELKN